jgi:hypothetical protein
VKFTVKRERVRSVSVPFQEISFQRACLAIIDSRRMRFSTPLELRRMEKI